MNKTVLGRTDHVDFPVDGIKHVPAKIDTGADGSAVWASDFTMTAGELSFVLFAKDSPYYTGRRHTTRSYTVKLVRSAHGTAQVRYQVQLSVAIAGKRIRGRFTLSDRSKNTYPVLIGCRLLNGRFLVDVSKGKPTQRERVENGLLTLTGELKRDPDAFFKKYHMNNPRGDIER